MFETIIAQKPRFAIKNSDALTRESDVLSTLNSIVDATDIVRAPTVMYVSKL